MAFVPVEYTNGARTEVADTPSAAVQYEWDGWVLTGDYVPSPPQEVRNTADVFEAVGGVFIWAGTDVNMPRPSLPVGTRAVWICTGVPVAMLDGDAHVAVAEIV